MAEDTATANAGGDVNNEIDEYVTSLGDYIKHVGELDVPPSHKGVRDRFVRDCQTLVNDMKGSQKPFNPDLVDFNDRFCSQEVQYNNLVENLS